jgi:hypothetical protein
MQRLDGVGAPAIEQDMELRAPELELGDQALVEHLGKCGMCRS